MKLDVKKTILIGFAFLSISMFWTFYDSVVTKLLVDTFGLNQAWSGFIMSLDNILALFLLPLFGNWSDKTRTKKYGKRTPYIFIGTVVAAIVIMAVGIVDFFQLQIVQEAGIGPILQNDATKYFYFNVNGLIHSINAKKEVVAAARSLYILENVTKPNIGYLLGFIGILLIALIAMASYRTPAVSLMPDITPKPLRSKANAIINLMGSVGGIIALGFTALLAKDFTSYIPAFIVLSVFMVVLLAVFMIWVKEAQWVKENNEKQLAYGLIDEAEIKDIEEGKGEKMPKDVFRSFVFILASIVLWFFAYNAATTKFSVYATNVLNMKSYTLPLLVANLTAIISFIPIGHIASIVGRKKTILVGIIIMTVAFILGSLLTPESSLWIWVTMGLAGIGWASINVNSYPMIVEMSKGSNIGKYTGYYYTASMAAQVLTPTISGFLMDQWGLRVLFPYSTVFIALAFVTMLFVKHGDSRPLVKGKLETLGGPEED